MRGEDWDETQNGAHRVRGMHLKLAFGCLYVFGLANTEIHTWEE